MRETYKNIKIPIEPQNEKKIAKKIAPKIEINS